LLIAPNGCAPFIILKAWQCMRCRRCWSLCECMNRLMHDEDCNLLEEDLMKEVFDCLRDVLSAWNMI
jgi:hypothetical protein